VLSTFAIAFSMSADAFAACLGKGAAFDRIRMREVVRTGLIFGSVETATPVLGWALGLAASARVAAIDHWVAFALLGIIGVKMIWEGITRSSDVPPARRHAAPVLVLVAIGTSLDAAAVGVTVALTGADIVVMALAIGAATCLMSGLGIAIGRLVGARLGRAAEAMGGITLVAVVTSILLSHLQLF
jgi:putative Mn2+ efflux pump MntP